MFIYSFHYLGTSLWSLCFPVWNICLLPIFLVQANQRSVEFVLRAAFGTDGEEASLPTLEYELHCLFLPALFGSGTGFS